MPINLSIYEDNDALRESLAFLISSTPDMKLCGVYPDCLNWHANCQANTPDIILMDIDMPGMTGIEATKGIKDKYPGIDVMMLTVYENRDKIFDALCAGATGYLLKKSTSTQIIEAIHDLSEGGSPMSGEIARKVLEFFTKPAITKNNDYALSARELDIVKCLVDGNSYKMIADACFISIGTVRSHINSIYRKLSVNSKSEVVIKAMKERLV